MYSHTATVQEITICRISPIETMFLEMFVSCEELDIVWVLRHAYVVFGNAVDVRTFVPLNPSSLDQFLALCRIPASTPRPGFASPNKFFLCCPSSGHTSPPSSPW